MRRSSLSVRVALEATCAAFLEQRLIETWSAEQQCIIDEDTDELRID